MAGVNIARFLIELICRFGCFEICHTDQGREFVNFVNKSLFELTGVVSATYHPQRMVLMKEQINPFLMHCSSTLTMSKMIGMSTLIFLSH